MCLLILLLREICIFPEVCIIMFITDDLNFVWSPDFAFVQKDSFYEVIK